MQGCCHIGEKTEPPINKCFHLLRVGTHCVHGGVGGNGGRPVCHGGPGTSVARIVHHCFELPAEDLSLLCPAFGSNASGAVTRWHTAGGPTMSAHPPEQFLFPVSPRACLIQRPVHGPTDFTLDLAAHPRDPRVRDARCHHRLAVEAIVCDTFSGVRSQTRLTAIARVL